jgi:5-methylcytosine-specific restriction enzyme subunit McrC
VTTIQVDELATIERRLSTEEAVALANTGLVSVTRAWTPGCFEITAGSRVGVLRIDDLEVRVKPKLPIRRVIYLLAHAVGLATWDEELLGLERHDRLDTALAAAFIAATNRALRFGPRSAYYNVEDDLWELRGRLDMNRQRLRYGIPLPIAVSFDEFGIDHIENQLLLGAARRLNKMTSLPAPLRTQLRHLTHVFDGVRPSLRHDAARPVHFSRLNDHYRPAIALARVVLQESSFDIGTGDRAATGFTVTMYRLFEAFLTATLTQSLERRHGGKLHAQRLDHLDEARKARILPDLTWVVDGRPQAIIDAKYKGIADGRPSDDDLYQMVAYCSALNVTHAHLVHAERPAERTHLAIRFTDIVVHIAGLDLASPLDELHAQIDALADDIAEPVNAHR